MINEYFSHIALINLLKRPDRKEASTKVLDDFGVKYEVWEATDNPDFPCRGLVDSMQRYFRKVLDAGGDRCLLFEDDILPLVDAETFNDTMGKSLKQLPNDWDLFYLGGNCASGLQEFYSANLLPVKMMYATHATAYSKKAMEFIVNKTINEPVDNFIVRELQPRNNVFITYPMLFTQSANYSDINKAYTDWSRFLEKRYDGEIEKIKKLKMQHEIRRTRNSKRQDRNSRTG